jgi:hypothetical protein
MPPGVSLKHVGATPDEAARLRQADPAAPTVNLEVDEGNRLAVIPLAKRLDCRVERVPDMARQMGIPLR